MAFILTPLGRGTVHFDPVDQRHVVLPGPGSSCRIEFTVSIVKLPSTDAQPAVDGMQTIPIASASMRSNNGTTGFARGSQAE